MGLRQFFQSETLIRTESESRVTDMAFEGFKETMEINYLLVFSVANLMVVGEGEFL